VLAMLAIVSVVCSVLVADEHKEAVRAWLVACWSVVPPLWFFSEFHWARATKDDAELKRLKESQELAGKIWAGVVAALSILYLKG